MSVLSLACFHLLLHCLSGVDGFFVHFNTRCRFSSRNIHNVEYLEQYYFNKKLLLLYNSTSEKYTGYYYEETMKMAEACNNDSALLAKKWRDMDKYCRNYAPSLYGEVLDKTVEPYVKLRSVEQADARHPAMLVCSAYDFYPRPIRVTWLRNKQKVTSDVTFTEALANGDWFYQIHSHLEYTPTPGEKITCMVEHASLHEPKLYDWDPFPESERNKMVIGVSGLVLGTVFVAAGLIYYWKKSTDGLFLVSTVEHM